MSKIINFPEDSHKFGDGWQALKKECSKKLSEMGLDKIQAARALEMTEQAHFIVAKGYEGVNADLSSFIDAFSNKTIELAFFLTKEFGKLILRDPH